MARITGFKCDGPKCSITAETERLPVGWLSLRVETAVATTGMEKPGMEKPGDRLVTNQRNDANTMHLCSNKCLKALATERYKAAVEVGTEVGSYHMERKLGRKTPRQRKPQN